jgi:hypothetical protein
VSKDIKKIKQGDAKFYLNDGVVIYPRATIQVAPECPSNVRETLNWGVTQGYITCVAYVYGKELTMDALRD